MRWDEYFRKRSIFEFFNKAKEYFIISYLENMLFMK